MTQSAIFDLKAASCVPAVTLLVSLGVLYLLDSAVIHIPFYEDFELLLLSAVFTLLAGLYVSRTDSYHFLAAALSGLTAFVALRAVFAFQQFANRCDVRGSVCALTTAFRVSTSLALFLTLIPCAGLYGAAVYVFMNFKIKPDIVGNSSAPIVVVGLPADDPKSTSNPLPV